MVTDTLRFYVTAPELIAEQDQFEKDIEEFKKGNINPVKFKAIRVAHGVYEQRQENTYMLRIRCAAGGITPTQLKKVAEMGDKYGSGEVHFTTRQEVQIHDLLIDGVMPAIRGLNEVGMSSRGGGGNTIRNILTSADSGVSPEDVFDVDPYAIALTTRMIWEADSWNLPRKFKIAFSNNEKDTAYTQTTCLGFVPKIRDGQRGFSVYCSGGMGAKPFVGHQLMEWIDDSRVYHVTKALKVMFDKHGNRRNRYENRIKFLWNKVGEAEFKKYFFEEYDKIKADDSLKLELVDLDNSARATSLAVEAPSDNEFELWKKRYVVDQKQAGLKSIKLPLQLGDLYREDADKLCDFLNEFGENNIRCDRAQNVRLRNIPEAYLPNAYNIIKGLRKTLVKHAPFIGNMINCTGAQTCKLGICLPRGLSSAIRDRLTESTLDLDAITDFKLNMSGCPNTCGMHHIADLGFFGKVGRQKDASGANRIFPAYWVLTGAEAEHEGQTKYAEKVGEIAAHHVPNFVHDFLEVYIDRKKKNTYASYKEYLAKEGAAYVQELLAKYKEVPIYEDGPGFYTDFGAKKELSLEELGTAECSAGLFDMIEVDQKEIEARIKAQATLTADAEIQENLYKILFHTARMLLVTRGMEATDEADTFAKFAKHFVQTELVSPSYLDVVVMGKAKLLSEIQARQTDVIDLANAIIKLYKGMDDSLRFPTESEKATAGQSKTDSVTKKDFRGVACPMNFVKTKLVLDTLKSGDKLEISLDDGEPIQNVPNSVKLEGHIVLEQKQVDNYWLVTIEKA